jgi:ATP-dependent Zn protease
MNRPIRALTSLSLVVCIAFSSLAGVALAAEEPTIVYAPIGESDFHKELASKKVKSVIVNKRLRTLRVTLTDGTHVLARYPKHEEPQTVAKLKREGIAVSVLGKSDAEKEAKAKKPTHHKIRYIVGGVLIVVIVVVGVVLLINRRRQRD